MAVAALVLVTSSCGGDDSEGTAPEPGSTVGATPSASAPAGGAAEAEDGSSGRADGAEPEAEVAVGDLANFSCTRRGSGAWFAEGDITNSTSDPMIYTLTVATVEGGDEVAAEQVKEFVLQPDETTGFDFAEFARGAADTCMPRLLRTPR